MKNRQRLLLCSLLGILTGCTQQEEAAPEAAADDLLGPGQVATVDGQRIPESVFRMYALNLVQKDADDLTTDERQQLVEQLVFLQVLANRAERDGLDKERRVAAELQLQHTQQLARAMSERFREENPPTETELRALYEENLPRLASTQYKTRHILVESEAEATDLISQLDGGADFATLAQEHSTGPTGPTGGDLDWISADSVVAPFGEAISVAEHGTPIPTPVQTQFGWHVILVEDSRDQVAPGLEAVRADLTRAVEQAKLDAFVTSLRDAAEVVIE